MTKGEFEASYAEASGLSVDELQGNGLVAVPCYCKEEGCKGWKMVRESEKLR